ncbi:hypothetical protein EVAR_93514_1 [Eumeta japonica]|uniref:Uncharacterized protein n=1 Tax=Eumeta variegata TaxID=151549 RepID=A0A4C1TKK8_EUMVA|nr:hypothetical protein EVAR_93514_1 [Eumeta japonica]
MFQVSARRLRARGMLKCYLKFSTTTPLAPRISSCAHEAINSSSITKDSTVKSKVHRSLQLNLERTNAAGAADERASVPEEGPAQGAENDRHHGVSVEGSSIQFGPPSSNPMLHKHIDTSYFLSRGITRSVSAETGQLLSRAKLSSGGRALSLLNAAARNTPPAQSTHSGRPSRDALRDRPARTTVHLGMLGSLLRYRSIRTAGSIKRAPHAESEVNAFLIDAAARRCTFTPRIRGAFRNGPRDRPNESCRDREGPQRPGLLRHARAPARPLTSPLGPGFTFAGHFHRAAHAPPLSLARRGPMTARNLDNLFRRHHYARTR